jgi:hypothetical protein
MLPVAYRDVAESIADVGVSLGWACSLHCSGLGGPVFGVFVSNSAAVGILVQAVNLAFDAVGRQPQQF